ncbi:MAG: GAF domain-containing protein, partial [Hyphomicrobiales bacterium]|nr:GAF domain-containing protein [Hyphomicrobiales bacterium]
HGAIHLREGDVYPLKSRYGFTPEAASLVKQTPPSPGRATLSGRIALSRSVECIPDVLEDEEFSPTIKAVIGARSLFGAPLLRDDRVEGMMILGRAEPGLFTPRQIELVRTFADQAVIAIENARLFDEVQAKTRDLEEALAQQTATADVLKVISRSAFDLQVVFRVLVENAVRLCGARTGMIFQRDGDLMRLAAAYGATQALTDYVRDHPFPASGTRQAAAGRALLERRTVQILDVETDPDYHYGAWLEHHRTIVAVPLMRNETPIGVFALWRHHVEAFTPRQLALVETFADQAVVAIENVRLFDEVQAKTRDLEEALAQQTATADVLKVISRSAFDLDAVLKTLTESARSLGGATAAVVFLRDREAMLIRAQSGCPPEFLAYIEANPIRSGRKTMVGRVMMTGEAVHLADVLADAEFSYGDAPQLGNYRANFGVPLIRDGKVDGVFGLMRPEPGAFTPRQIEMVRAFADQAVIAIENVRLFNEVQAKTRDLEESLAQQTATADVLKVISRSAFDLQSVLETLIEAAVKLSGADRGSIHLRDGEAFPMRAASRSDAAFLDYMRAHPQTPGRGSVVGRVALSGKVETIADILEDDEFALPPSALAGTRAVLGAPLLREGGVVGVLVLTRYESGVFTERQIELVQTFADQAVIAIENSRLFEEVQAKTRDLEEALAQQTATADALKVISRSAFDLPAVLRTLVESAAKLCDADGATITREVDGVFYRAESYGFSDEFMAKMHNVPVVPERGSMSGRAILEGKAIQVEDVEADPEYWPTNFARPGELRTGLGIPMMRNGVPIGALALMRTAVRPFGAKQIELVQTFADQAVIAIENARLFNEVQAKTHDLEEALAQQTATADVLKVISRSAFDLQAVFDTLTESAAKLIGAASCVISLREDDVFPFRSIYGGSAELIRWSADHPLRAGRGTAGGRVILSGKVELIPDILEDKEYSWPLHRLQGVRSVLSVPLLREGRVEGVFGLNRQEPGGFSDREIELAETFADQAMIAIENARLFDEVQAKTRDLEEALAQQ